MPRVAVVMPKGREFANHRTPHGFSQKDLADSDDDLSQATISKIECCEPVSPTKLRIAVRALSKLTGEKLNWWDFVEDWLDTPLPSEALKATAALTVRDAQPDSSASDFRREYEHGADSAHATEHRLVDWDSRLRRTQPYSRRRPFPRGWRLATIACVLTVSWASVMLAYWKGTEAWEHKFNLVSHSKYSDDAGVVACLLRGHAFPMGWLIEGTRGTIAIFVGLVLLPSLFPRAFYELIPRMAPTGPRLRLAKYKLLAYSGLLISAVLLGGLEIVQLQSSADKLHQWGLDQGLYKHAQSLDRECYLLYLPYSLINYCLVVPLLFVVPSFAGIHMARSNPKAAFRSGLECLQLLMWMCIWLAFESWLGLYTLSSGGIARAVFIWAPVSIIAGYFVPSRIYSRFPNMNLFGHWLWRTEFWIAASCVALSLLHFALLPLCRS